MSYGPIMQLVLLTGQLTNNITQQNQQLPVWPKHNYTSWLDKNSNIKPRFNIDFTTFDNVKTVKNDAPLKPKTFGVENDISWILSGRRNQNKEIQKALDRKRQTTSDVLPTYLAASPDHDTGAIFTRQRPIDYGKRGKERARERKSRYGLESDKTSIISMNVLYDGYETKTYAKHMKPRLAFPGLFLLLEAKKLWSRNVTYKSAHLNTTMKYADQTPTCSRRTIEDVIQDNYKVDGMTHGKMKNRKSDGSVFDSQMKDHQNHQKPPQQYSTHKTRHPKLPPLLLLLLPLLAQISPASSRTTKRDLFGVKSTGHKYPYNRGLGNEDYPENGWTYHDIQPATSDGSGWLPKDYSCGLSGESRSLMGGLRESDQSRQNRCYSCMSRSYQDNWKSLDKLYKMPHIFTDRCNQPFDERTMGTINCTTICVKLREPQYQGGMFIGWMFIRGCLDHVLVNGFNSTAIKTHGLIQNDKCRTLPRSKLFNPMEYSSDRLPLQGEVEICACYGDKCNGTSSSARRKSSLWLFVFVIISSWRCYLL